MSGTYRHPAIRMALLALAIAALLLGNLGSVSARTTTLSAPGPQVAVSCTVGGQTTVTWSVRGADTLLLRWGHRSNVIDIVIDVGAHGSLSLATPADVHGHAWAAYAYFYDRHGSFLAFNSEDCL